MAGLGRQRLYQNVKCADCDRQAILRGYCDYHYKRARVMNLLPLRPGTDPLLYFLKRTLRNIKWRCENPKFVHYRYYGGKGIKNKLSLEDLRFLYIRDNANLLERPSIDRIDPNKNYTLDNCRFIELRKNCAVKAATPCVKCGAVGSYHRNRVCPTCRSLNHCKRCKRSFEKSGSRIHHVCQDCRTIKKPCGQCGAIVIRDTVDRKGTTRSQQWFCNKSHYQKWLSENLQAA